MLIALPIFYPITSVIRLSFSVKSKQHYSVANVNRFSCSGLKTTWCASSFLAVAEVYLLQQWGGLIACVAIARQTQRVRAIAIPPALLSTPLPYLLL